MATSANLNISLNFDYVIDEIIKNIIRPVRLFFRTQKARIHSEHPYLSGTAGAPYLL